MPNNLNSFKIITDFLDNSAKVFPNKAGLIFGDKEYSYSQIKERADNLSWLLRNNTKKGDVIALLSSNIPEMIFSYFGILKSGCIVLLLSANISDENLVFQIKKTKPKLIFSHKKYKSKLERTKVLEKINYFDIKKMPLSEKATASIDTGENDVAVIIFTSGTTAEPKGAVLRHRNVVSAVKNITEFLKWKSSDIDVNILTLSHSFGLGNILCIFAAGGTVVLFPDSINLRKIINAIIEKKATTFAAVPATLRLILNNYLDDFKKCDKYLRFVQTNTSPLNPKMIKEIVAALPSTDFNYYYGLTEASRSAFIALNKNLDKIKSAGKISPNVELKIVNGQGENASAGEVGEICIKGRHVIQEYWQNPEANKKIKNSWLHTNDAGYLDKDGYLYFQGRNDDIINVSGEKVSPEEIENIASAMPGIIDAVAVAMPDKLLGEAVKVFVKVENKDFNTDKVIQECRKKLEIYKIPKEVEIVKEIPRTENGKLRRPALKDNYKNN